MLDPRLERIRQQMDEAKERILREYTEHHFTCPDPVRCEFRAWQALFAAERSDRRRVQAAILSNVEYVGPS